MNNEQRTLVANELLAKLAGIALNPAKSDHVRVDASMTMVALLQLQESNVWQESITENEWNMIQIGAELCSELEHFTIHYLMGW